MQRLAPRARRGPERDAATDQREGRRGGHVDVGRVVELSENT